jgi:hypothetical protein
VSKEPSNDAVVLTLTYARTHRCLDVVPEKFANLTKEDVPNSLKYYSDFFSMLEEEFNTLPDAEPEPSPLESNPELSLTQEQERVLQMAMSGMSLFFTGWYEALACQASRRHHACVTLLTDTACVHVVRLGPKCRYRQVAAAQGDRGSAAQGPTSGHGTSNRTRPRSVIGALLTRSPYGDFAFRCT